MSDYVYVNIRNKGQIPWIKKIGPLYGYRISSGMYDFLSRDPRVDIQITTQAEGERLAKVHAAKEAPKATTPIEKLEPKDEVVIEEIPVAEEKKVYETPEITVEVKEENEPIEEKVELFPEVEATSEDDEIDAILKDAPTPEMKIIKLDPIEESSEEDVRFKYYSDDELAVMTKLELKNILRNRGYEKGVYAPKYHDKLEDLIKKVKRTQTFK